MNKKIPFWDAGRDYLRYGKTKKNNKLLDKIHRVLSKGQLVLGYNPDIEEFENKFAKYVGTKYAIMCGAGTHALRLAYRSIGIGHGDEVITTSLTFAATFDQIVAVGAKPILVDIGDDGLIDPKEIEKAITPRTKAIVPVHLEGKVCDMVRIKRIAKERNLYVIEDAAQSLGAGLNGKKTGSMGDVGCFSLFPAKALGSLGNAGMVTTNDKLLAQKIRMLRCNYNLGKNPDLSNAEFGDNLEPDGIHASVLNIKIKDHDSNLKRRKVVATMYDRGLGSLPIKLPVKQKERIYQDYVIRIDVKDKKDFLELLDEKKIGYLGHNLHGHHEYKKLNLPYLEKTDIYLKEQIRIPCNPNILNRDVRYIIKIIKSFYDKR